MEYKVLNGTDLKVSRICLGGGNFGEKLDRETVFQVLDTYIDGGGNFIDTANVYCRWIPGLANSSEKMIGEWLESRSAKNNVIIATKGGHYDLQSPLVSRVTKADIRLDLTESMKTLLLDRIDLYWLHRDDPNKPVEEIVDYMEELVREGSIRYYGASNFSQKRLEEASIYARKNHLQGFSAVSNMWSAASINPVFDSMRDATMELMGQALYEWHKETGLPMIPYTSTANGFFEKLYRAGARVEEGRLLTPIADLELSEHLLKIYLNDRNLRLYEVLLEIHKETGASVIALSLAFLISQPFDVIPVGSVTKPEQLNGLLEAGGLKLDPQFKKKFQKFIDL